tara:strand:- start:338 stop:799 length:462 start_codon:yes stop_codon:yes gene_type:complete
MQIANDWGELLYTLECLSKGSAKRKFREIIKYSWGGVCAYCRSNRADTIDHIKPKCHGGGNSLRSNLLPCCQQCNHSKGSENWLVWFEQQSFFNITAKELIDEWIANKRFIEEQLDEQRPGSNNRATIRVDEGALRNWQDEPTKSGKNCLAVA